MIGAHAPPVVPILPPSIVSRPEPELEPTGPLPVWPLGWRRPLNRKFSTSTVTTEQPPSSPAARGRGKPRKQQHQHPRPFRRPLERVPSGSLAARSQSLELEAGLMQISIDSPGGRSAPPVGRRANLDKIGLERGHIPSSLMEWAALARRPSLKWPRPAHFRPELQLSLSKK